MPSPNASLIRNPAAWNSWIGFTFQKRPLFSSSPQVWTRKNPSTRYASTCASEAFSDKGREPVTWPAWLQARSTPCKPILGIDWSFHMSPWVLWRALHLRLRSFVCSSLWVYPTEGPWIIILRRAYGHGRMCFSCIGNEAAYSAPVPRAIHAFYLLLCILLLNVCFRSIFFSFDLYSSPWLLCLRLVSFHFLLTPFPFLYSETEGRPLTVSHRSLGRLPPPQAARPTFSISPLIEDFQKSPDDLYRQNDASYSDTVTYFLSHHHCFCITDQAEQETLF